MSCPRRARGALVALATLAVVAAGLGAAPLAGAAVPTTASAHTGSPGKPHGKPHGKPPVKPHGHHGHHGQPTQPPQPVTPGLGASPAVPFPGDTELTDKSGYSGFWRSVAGTIVASDGLSLDDEWWHSTGTWQLESRPLTPIADRAGFQVNGTSPGMVVTFQVYDAGKASGYWIGAKFASPSVGANQWSCALYKGDPRARTAKPNAVAPYTCTWSDVRGFNPTPVLSVRRGTVVTDQAQAQDLLADLCNTPGAADRCAFINFGYGTKLGATAPLGSVVFNRSDAEVEKKVGGETEESTRDTFGVEIGLSVELFEIFKASVKTSYEHEWETSHTFSEETTVEMKEDSVAWMTFAPLQQGTTGTWVIDDGDTTWLVPAFTMTGPLPSGGEINVYGCAIDDYKDGACTVEPVKIKTVQQ